MNLRTRAGEGYSTFSLHSRSKHTDSTGIHCWLHIEPCREVWHILAPVPDGESVRARIQRDVRDGVGPISVVLDVNLGLSAAVRDDLNGQVGRASIGTVHEEFPFLPDLGALQTWARAANLRTDVIDMFIQYFYANSIWQEVNQTLDGSEAG